MGDGFEARGQRFRQRQRKIDQAALVMPKAKKQATVMPDYFSHFPGLKTINPVDIERFESLRKLLSRKRDHLTGLYLTIILSQNPDIDRRADYNRPQRDALAEQSVRFMAEKNVMTFMLGDKLDLEGKITSYDNYFNLAQDQSQYGLILARDIVETCDAVPRMIFERYLRENPVIDMKKKKSFFRSEIINVELDERGIKEAIEIFDSLYPSVDDKKAYNKCIKEQKLLYALTRMFNRFNSDKEDRSYNLLNIYMSSNFKEVFKKHIEAVKERQKEEKPIERFNSRLSPAGILICCVNPDWRIDDKVIEPQEVIRRLGSNFRHIATYNKGNESYIAFAKPL